MAEAAPAAPTTPPTPRVADATRNTNLKNNLAGFFTGQKRIPATSFYGYLFCALIIDFLFFWLPGAGTVFIAFCRATYFVNGYKTDKMTVTTWVDALIEVFPVLEILPATTFFVIMTYIINVAETNEAGASLTRTAFVQKAARFAGGYATANSLGKSLKGFGGANVTANDNVAPKKTSSAGKSAELVNNKNLDGMIRPPNIHYGETNGVSQFRRGANDNALQAANDK